MIDEVDEVKMEVTVRTLNSAKLKWKLSRMILFRVHAQRGNLSEILSGIFLVRKTEANKFPLETWSGVSLFYRRFSIDRRY